MNYLTHLLSQGFALLPCNPATKAPLIANGSRAASNDPATVARWWARYPDALIGVATGGPSRLFAIDHDAYKECGFSAAWLYERKEELATFTYSTRAGGTHYLYRSSAGLIGRNSQGVKVEEGKLSTVDLRGDGGYVIYWPAHGGRVLNDGPIQTIGEDFFQALHMGSTRAPLTCLGNQVEA